MPEDAGKATGNDQLKSFMWFCFLFAVFWKPNYLFLSFANVLQMFASCPSTKCVIHLASSPGQVYVGGLNFSTTSEALKAWKQAQRKKLCFFVSLSPSEWKEP